MEIRAERAEDAAAIGDVHRVAFGGRHGVVVATLVDDLRASTDESERVSLVAVADNERPVGHVLFTPCLLDAPSRLVTVQVLSPVAVLPPFRHGGLATSLMRRGLESLAQCEVPAVFLEGPPGFYSRFGFVPAAECGFRKPSLRIPDEAFQVLRLPRYEPWMTGTLVYSDAFWRNDVVGLRDV
jgi:putative acetyltransferase